MSSKRILKPHWIIIHNKNNAIWKRPFFTLEEAKKELNDQLGRHEYKNSGWEIEERQTFMDVDDVAGGSDEFNSF